MNEVVFAEAPQVLKDARPTLFVQMWEKILVSDVGMFFSDQKRMSELVDKMRTFANLPGVTGIGLAYPVVISDEDRSNPRDGVVIRFEGNGVSPEFWLYQEKNVTQLIRYADSFSEPVFKNEVH